MALITVNGQDVLDFSASMPRSGAWTADLLVDDLDALTGAATIDINSGSLVLRGTIIRSGVFVDTAHVRIVAGAGGLGVTGSPKHYNGVSVGVILGDLLATAGETLSATVDQGILSAALDAWDTTAVRISTLITLLLRAGAPGASWRMLADGTLWIGTETWPDAGIDPSTYAIFEDSAEQNSMLIGVDAPLMLVGTTFEGRKVSRVDHLVQMNGGKIESRVWFEDATPSTTDRLKGAIARLVRDVVPGIDYRARYWAVIIGQDTAPHDPPNTVDVQLEQVNGKDLLPDMGAVPLLLGIPGTTVKGTVGGRVLIGWAGGDPSQPYAEGFDVGTSLTGSSDPLLPLPPGELVIAGGSSGVARMGDSTKLTMSPQDIVSLATALLATGGFMTSGSPPSPPPTPLPFTGGEITAGSSIVKVG